MKTVCTYQVLLYQKLKLPARFRLQAQVPLMGSVTATTITSEAVGGSGNPQDFDTVLPTDTKANYQPIFTCG